MTEHVQPESIKTEPAEDERYRDESAYVTSQLAQLMEGGERFAIKAEGLYLQLPGQIYGGTRYIDKGCRGGWSERYEATLRDQPVALALIERQYNGLNLRFVGGGATTLAPDEVANARFLVDPATWQAEAPATEVNVTVRDLLKPAPYVSLTCDDINGLTDWRHTVSVQSARPFEQPVTYSRRDRHGAVTYSPLFGEFERIESYYDSAAGITRARVIIDEGRHREAVATPWVPLESLSFSEKELPDYAAYRNRIGKLALDLCHDQTAAIYEMNQLLGEVPSVYRHQYQPARHSGLTDQIIVGRADAGTIRSVTATPIQKPDSFRGIQLAAERVVSDRRHQPWVVGPSGLSLPLHHLGEFSRAEDHSALQMNCNLEDLIEHAKNLAE